MDFDHTCVVESTLVDSFKPHGHMSSEILHLAFHLESLDWNEKIILGWIFCCKYLSNNLAHGFLLLLLLFTHGCCLFDYSRKNCWMEMELPVWTTILKQTRWRAWQWFVHYSIRSLYFNLTGSISFTIFFLRCSFLYSFFWSLVLVPLRRKGNISLTLFQVVIEMWQIVY